MELKYFIDLFQCGGGSPCCTVELQAHNRSMTGAPGSGSGRKLSVVCCSPLSPHRIIQSSPDPIWQNYFSSSSKNISPLASQIFPV